MVPAADASNLVEPDAVRGVVREVRRALPGAPRRVALAVPDSAAKVSLLRFEKTPARPADLDQLVRWQVRRTAPFRIEDAQVAWAPGAPLDGGGREFVVRLMRRDVVEEYEGACAGAGAHAGVVDVASLGLVDAALAGGPPADADWLLVHAAAGYRSIAIVRRGHVILFRCRPDGAGDGDDDLVDLVHQTTMYYEDRLGGGGYGRVSLAVSRDGATAGDAARLRRLIAAHLDAAVTPAAVGGWADPRPDGDPRPDSDPRPDVFAAPAGLLMRAHAPAAA